MNVAVDATGFAVRSSKLVWLSSGVRMKERRAFVKAHLAVETTWLSVQPCVLTSSPVHETTLLGEFLEPLRPLGDVYAVPGYLRVENVWLVTTKGGTPYFKLKATTVVVSELKPGSEEFGKHGEEFLCDGIFHTKMERVDDANIQCRIRCVKMRGTAHSPNFHTLIFQNGVLQVTRILAEAAPIVGAKD